VMIIGEPMGRQYDAMVVRRYEAVPDVAGSVVGRHADDTGVEPGRIAAPGDEGQSAMTGDDDVCFRQAALLGNDPALGREHPAADRIGAAVDDAEVEA